MNRGFLESLPVQKMMNLTPNWWNINTSTMKPSPPQQQQSSSPHLIPSSAGTAPPSHHLFPHHEFAHQANSLPLINSWHDISTNQELPVESWSQLLLGGGGSVVGEEEEEENRSGMNNYPVVKKLENWEEQILYPPPSIHVVDVKQEISENAYLFALRNQGGFSSTTDQAGIRPPNWSDQQLMPVSSPSSCVTAATFNSSNNNNNNNNNMLDFSNRKSDGRHPQPDHSSECNSTSTGGTFKKARVQPSSTLSTFKVRKEKLGDRITALHQLVSPFGKTDTASVLLEAIGYIRFLQSQIEALSSPYMGNASGNMRQQHSVQATAGEKSSIFPDDPGQLLNNDTSCMKRRGLSDHQDPDNEPKKDLRSRGLCLVPVSCTLQVGSDNGADYWAPAALGGGFR